MQICGWESFRFCCQLQHKITFTHHCYQTNFHARGPLRRRSGRLLVRSMMWSCMRTMIILRTKSPQAYTNTRTHSCSNIVSIHYEVYVECVVYIWAIHIFAYQTWCRFLPYREHQKCWVFGLCRFALTNWNTPLTSADIVYKCNANSYGDMTP